MLGEFLVTFLFLLIIECVAVNKNRTGDQNEMMIVGALLTSFSATALIYSFADVSGSHFNPSVTFAVMVTGKMSWKKVML